ncbi:MAG: tetratricopeptide repeat protein [Cyanobacteria bacterium SZAS LIN-2]|nr:tetratricopeptide repeat protein [Cyanobacteria bacterium SZAS LIN-2]
MLKAPVLLSILLTSAVYFPFAAGAAGADGTTSNSTVEDHARALQKRVFGSAPAGESLEERLKTLEAFALGRTHPDDMQLSADARLERIEEKLNGRHLPTDGLPPVNQNIFDPGNPFASDSSNKVLPPAAPKAIPKMQDGPVLMSDPAEDILPGTLVDQIKEMAKRVMGSNPDGMAPADLIAGLELFKFGQAGSGLLSERFARLQAAESGQAPTAPADSSASSGTPDASTSPDASPDVSTMPGYEVAQMDTTGPQTGTKVASTAMPVLKGLPGNNFTLPSFGGESGDRATMILRGGVLSVGAGRVQPKAHKAVMPSAAEELKTFKEAGAAAQSGNYAKAAMLYQELAKRHPLDPRYFYGAGTAYEAMRDNFNAFPNLIIAWHHGSSDPVYEQTIDALVEAMKKQIDPNWRKTYGFQASDPETILNAGARCFKAGLTAESIQLFEYAAKTEPWYAPAAAYNLGAVAESRGNLKLALQYYRWADNQAARLEQEVASVAPAYSVPYQVALNKSEQVVSRTLIGQAIDQVQSHMATGDTTWHGWTQADVTTLPKFWASEVCPSCAINRTSATY